MSVTPIRNHKPEEGDRAPGMDVDDTVELAVKGRAVRGRSTIEFPYADLDGALEVARTIHEKGGVSLARDQLAKAMNQPVTSGAFSAKLHASRLFGFTEFVPGKIKISELGCEALENDEGRARAAKVKAFLNVALFARAYNEFRNRQLPPRPHGLEQAFVGFGVLEKRGANARWAFDRSARQAGFFDGGDNRLVEPIISPGATTPIRRPTEPELQEPTQKPAAAAHLEAANESLIQGLLARLPPTDSEWPITERARWLRTLAVNLAMLYGTNEEAEIQIAVPKAPAKNPNPASEPSTPPAQPTARTPPTLQPKLPEREERSRENTVGPNWDAPRGVDLDDEIPF